jgi:xylose isomerase
MGTDPFSNVKTHLRPWDVAGSMDTFLTRVDVAFEFFTKHLEALNIGTESS